MSQEESTRTGPSCQVTPAKPPPADPRGCWHGPSPSPGDSSWITPHGPLTSSCWGRGDGTRGTPNLGRNGANLQDTGQGMLSRGGRLQFGPGLGGSLEESEKKAQARLPLLPRDSSGHLGTGQPPKVHQSLPSLGTRVPRRGRGAGGNSCVPIADLEWLLGRSLIQSEKKSAQHSHHRVQKKPKTRDKAQGWAPPTHTGRSTTDLCTASPRQERRRTESPNAQASMGKRSRRSPRGGAGLAGPGGSRSCRADGGWEE